MDEAHVEHAVGFVEHQTFDIAEPKRVALDEIEQPAGRGDQNVDAVERARGPALPIGTPPIASAALMLQMAAVGAEAVEDLAGQFARRAEHQDAAALAYERLRVGGEMMQDRQREGRGLAGSGLGDSDHVAARHDGRDGLRLDRCRREVFFFGERTRDRVIKLEVVEVGQRKKLSMCALARPLARCAGLHCG